MYSEETSMVANREFWGSVIVDRDTVENVLCRGNIAIKSLGILFQSILYVAIKVLCQAISIGYDQVRWYIRFMNLG